MGLLKHDKNAAKRVQGLVLKNPLIKQNPKVLFCDAFDGRITFYVKDATTQSLVATSTAQAITDLSTTSHRLYVRGVGGLNSEQLRLLLSPLGTVNNITMINKHIRSGEAEYGYGSVAIVTMKVSSVLPRNLNYMSGKRKRHLTFELAHPRSPRVSSTGPRPSLSSTSPPSNPFRKRKKKSSSLSVPFKNVFLDVKQHCASTVPAAEQSLTTNASKSAPADPPAPVVEPFSLSLNETLPTDVPVSVTTEPFTPAAKPSSIPVPKPSPVPEPASTLPPCMFYARGHCRAGQLCNYPHVGRSLHNPLTRHPPVSEQTAEVKVPALATTYVPDVDPSSSSSVPTLSSYLGSGASDVRPGTPRTVHLHPDRSDS